MKAPKTLFGYYEISTVAFAIVAKEFSKEELDGAFVDPEFKMVEGLRESGTWFSGFAAAKRSMLEHFLVCKDSYKNYLFWLNKSTRREVEDCTEFDYVLNQAVKKLTNIDTSNTIQIFQPYRSDDGFWVVALCNIPTALTTEMSIDETGKISGIPVEGDGYSTFLQAKKVAVTKTREQIKDYDYIIKEIKQQNKTACLSEMHEYR